MAPATQRFHTLLEQHPDIVLLVCLQNGYSGWTFQQTYSGLQKELLCEYGELLEMHAPKQEKEYTNPTQEEYWGFCSELGDITYLWIRLQDLCKRDNLSMTRTMLEIGAVAYMTSLCKHVDLIRAVIMKILRNHLKYPRVYDEDIPRLDWIAYCKKRWKEWGGDTAFFTFFEESEEEGDIDLFLSLLDAQYSKDHGVPVQLTVPKSASWDGYTFDAIYEQWRSERGESQGLGATR